MGALTSAVVGIGGAMLAKKSADKQAKTVREGQDAATDELRRQYDQTRADFEPYREHGVNALNALRNPVENFYASPDYEFRRNEGIRDIGNLYSAKGSGGNALRALADYSSNLASGEFGDWFNRTFAQSEAGRGATGTVGMAGDNAARGVASIGMNAANNVAGIKGDSYANINNALNAGISNIIYDRKRKQAAKKPPTQGGT